MVWEKSFEAYAQEVLSRPYSAKTKEVLAKLFDEIQKSDCMNAHRNSSSLELNLKHPDELSWLVKGRIKTFFYQPSDVTGKPESKTYFLIERVCESGVGKKRIKEEMVDYGYVEKYELRVRFKTLVF